MSYTPEEVEWMRKAMGITDEPEPIKPVITPNAPAVSDAGEYLLLENIACSDADGNLIEQYPKLYVKKDVERTGGNHLRFTPYKAAEHFEHQNNGLFVPSFALSCNLLGIIWQNKDNPEFAKVLEQYKDYGPGYGWHAQNTLVDYAGQQIIHYPADADFTSNGGNNNINNSKRKSLPFAKNGLKSITLEAALNDANIMRFVRQFTCMEHPEMLVEIGKYFGKQAKIWFPNGDATNCNETRAAWLGCDNSSFDLDASDYLGYNDAARGVRSSS